MKQAYLPTISIAARANIYRQLSQLEQAGFSAQQSCDLLEKSAPKMAKYIQQMQKQLNQGHSISESGFKAGIFTLFDRPLLLAGESSGKLADIYQKLADYYLIKDRRYRHIKSKLRLPILVLILAIFIQPLPLLVSSKINGFDYLLVTVDLLLKIALVIYIIYKLSAWLMRCRWGFLGIKNLFYYLQLNLPIISKWVIARQINNFMYSLGLMLSAGFPIVEALPKATNSIKNNTLRAHFMPAISSIQKGNSLTQSLSHITQIDSQIIHQLSIGENSGKLAETLLHFTDIQASKIKLQEDLLTEWIPRIIYLMIVITLAHSIIISNPFSPIAL